MGRKLLPKLDCAGLIDVSEDNHPDFLDVFLLAKCQFALVSGSGPNSIPVVFGTPSIWTNNFPWIPAPLDSDLVLYKRVKEGDHFLSANKILRRYAFTHSFDVLERDGISLVENSPEELLEGVKEMLQRVETRNYKKTVHQLMFDQIRSEAELVKAGASQFRNPF